MLFEQLGKRRNRNVERVHAIVVFKPLELGRARDTSRFLECLELGFRVGVDEIGQGAKRLGFGIIQEAALLEEERQILLASDLG